MRLTTSPTNRFWPAVLWAVLIPGACVAGYLFLTMFWMAVTANTELSPMVLASCAALTMALAVMALRWLKPSSITYAPAPPARSQKPWVLVGLVLVTLLVSFLAGQAIGITALLTVGSENFQRSLEARAEAPTVITLLYTLAVAPVSEELLMRGLMYPLLRHKLSAGLSTAITTLSFSVLHLNLVQTLTVLPVSVLLCWVYEHTRNIWWCVAGHIVFNLLAVLTPPTVIVAVAQPVLASILVLTFAVLLFMLNRHQRDDTQPSVPL